MTYRTIRDGKVIEHRRDRNGAPTEREVQAVPLVCDRCGWRVTRVMDTQLLPGCICGGSLLPPRKPVGKGK